MQLKTCEICLTEHFDELPCPNCETSIDLSEVEEAKPIGFISDETRQWLLDENGRGPGMFTPNRNGAGGVWAIYGGWEYKRLITIAKNLQKQCVLMHGVVAAARTLYEETEEYDFPDGMGKGALQEYWDALADALEPELDAAIKAAQPQEYPSSADDEVTRWRHGEPIGEVLSVQENKVVPNETFTVIVPHGKTAPPIGTKVFAQPERVSMDGDETWTVKFCRAILAEASPERVSVPREPSNSYYDAIWQDFCKWCPEHLRPRLSIMHIRELVRSCHRAMLAAAQEGK